MAYSAVTTAEIASGKPITNALMEKIRDNLEYLYGTLGSLSTGAIQNASFEIDSDDDGAPDNWDVNLYTGGSSGLYETDPGHGAKTLYFTHPGGGSNGGGYADSDYIEVTELRGLILSWWCWATAAGMKNEVQIRYFDKDKSELVSGSPETIWSSTANITTKRLYKRWFNPPDTCQFIKIRLIGGYTDTDVAGTIYFDDLYLERTEHYYFGDGANVQAFTSLASGTSSTSPVNTKTLTAIVTGRFRFNMSLAATNLVGTAYGRFYLNGSPVGTQRSTVSSGSWSEDLAIDIGVGDVIALYNWVSTGSEWCSVTGCTVTGELRGT